MLVHTFGISVWVSTAGGYFSSNTSFKLVSIPQIREVPFTFYSLTCQLTELP